MFWSILNLASEIFKFLKTQLGATRLRVLFSDSLLVNAIQYILNGERNETVLLEPLKYDEAAIIHLILQGIENPDSLANLFNS